jgi:hypothetical protein
MSRLTMTAPNDKALKRYAHVRPAGRDHDAADGRTGTDAVCIMIVFERDAARQMLARQQHRQERLPGGAGRTRRRGAERSEKIERAR